MLCRLAPSCNTISSLLREAGSQVDETPKRQSEDPTVDTHAIFDSKSKMRIYLRLGGIFSCFKIRKLTQSEQDNWEEHEVVFLTPDADSWDPNDESFAREEEDAYLDPDSDIDLRDQLPRKDLISDGNISALYTDPVSVADFETWCDRVAQILSVSMATEMADHETVRLNEDPIRAHIADTSEMFDP